MLSNLPSSISTTTTTRLFTIKHVNKPAIKWILILGIGGMSILIGIGCYLRYRRRAKPKSLQATQLMRSGVWKSFHSGAASSPLTPVSVTRNHSSDQLFHNGVIAFQQAVVSWRTCCEMLDNQEAELDATPEDSDFSDSITTIHSIPITSNSNISHRRVRDLLSQAEYLSQSIDRIVMRSRSSLLNNGSIRDVFRGESCSSDHVDSDYKGLPNSPLTVQPYFSDDNNNKQLEDNSDTDSYQSATIQSDTSSICLSINLNTRKHSIPRIILTTNALYNEALTLAENNSIFVRHMRTEMLHCESDIDFIAKLHCVRAAFDFLVESEENCLFFENQTLEMMTRFLLSANKDPNTFSDEFKNMINFVKTPQNIQTINKELNARNLKIVGFWDVAIDFALLDAFTDLENLPSPVTMVTQNRWLTPGLRESAMTNAVWAIMQGKIKMLENPNGFMLRFYKLGETFMFTLAWGFLGTDDVLKETCFVLKNGILTFLRDIFDLRVANYSNIQTLSEDIVAIGRDRMNLLKSHL